MIDQKYLNRKRYIDTLLALIGLIVLSPVFLLLIVAIKLDSPGSVLFRQKRVGIHKKHFDILKFRTMRTDTPKDTPTHLLENPDQYITKVGKFMRKTSLDELPQIINILRGEMAVIGPRPALWNQYDLIEERDKYHANDVLPGLTGWAQIHGRDELEIPEKAKLDGYYVEHMSHWMDLKCFFGTIFAVLRSDGVVEGGTGEMKREQTQNDESIDNIYGKKILFFAPAFFGYENKIAKKMEDLGAIVDLYNVRSVTSAKDRALLKISPLIFAKRSQKYYEKIICDNYEKNYDYILIVKCDMTPENILIRLRTVFPTAKICLYLWDSIDNIQGIKHKFKYFDTIHSFDMEDCIQYKELKFRPLFYTDEFFRETYQDNCVYDICFVGTVHSDRYKVIKKVKELANDLKFSSYWFCYLQSIFIYYFYKFTKKEFRGTNLADFSFEKKDSNEISEIINKSKIILDIQHPKQTGLTMRTIEMLGMKKKIITTNTAIKKYDFYNPNNIYIIDRKKINIDNKFFYSDYEMLSNEIYQKYSLKNWIFDVLS